MSNVQKFVNCAKVNSVKYHF